jgi:hypothetical protein
MRILTVIESIGSGPDGEAIALLARVAAITDESSVLVFGSAVPEAAIQALEQTGVG